MAAQHRRPRNSMVDYEGGKFPGNMKPTVSDLTDWRSNTRKHKRYSNRGNQGIQIYDPSDSEDFEQENPFRPDNNFQYKGYESMDYDQSRPDKKNSFEASNIRNINIVIGNRKLNANNPETRPATPRPQNIFRKVSTIEKVSNSQTSNLGSNNGLRYNNPQINSNIMRVESSRNQNQQMFTGRQNNGKITVSNVKKVQKTHLGTTVSTSRVEDSISKVIASCRSDLYCAPEAYCVKGLGFCRCGNGYRGNGFFCWMLAQLNLD